MYLTAHGRELLESTLTPLLRYANQRLDVTRGEVNFQDEEAEARADLVARALWQHIDLIADFVRDNPFQLDSRHLDVARHLSDTIYDTFVFEGTCDDHLLLLHETGIYHALAMSEQDCEWLPDQAVCARTALAPFEGDIVMLIPFTVTGVADEQVCRQVHSLNEKGIIDGPLVEGGELHVRASQWRLQKERKRHKERKNSARRKGAGPGYHRGILTGLRGEERERACAERFNLLALTSGSHLATLSLRSTEASFFPLTLEEGLQQLDDDWLESVLQHFTGVPADCEISRQQMIEQLLDRIVHDTDQRDNALLWCEPDQFRLFRKLMRENPLSLNLMPPIEACKLYPLIPYVFILREKETFVAWMAPEVRRLMADVDLDQIEHARSRLAQAARAADALASMCGIITLDDAYERYRRVAQDPLDREQFELALIEMQVSDRRDTYALWTHKGVDYVVCTELSEASAMSRVLQDNYSDRALNFTKNDDGDGSVGASLVVLDEHDEQTFELLLDKEVNRLESMRLKLLTLSQDLPPHELEPGMLHASFVDYLLETPPLVRVRDYVDRHMPDDEDDYVFPTTFARALVISSLFMRESYEDALDIIRLFNMTKCEGNTYPHLLGRLVSDVFNALPRWEMNGWSLTENTERISGKKPVLCADIVLGDDSWEGE